MMMMIMIIRFQGWWYTPLTPETEAEDCKPEANSGCIVSVRPAFALQWESVSKNQKKKKNKEEEKQNQEGTEQEEKEEETKLFQGWESIVWAWTHTCEALGTLYMR